MENEGVRTELVKLSPAAGVTVTSVMGVPLSDWVYIVTIIYVIIQCVCLIYKTFFKRVRL